MNQQGCTGSQGLWSFWEVTQRLSASASTTILATRLQVHRIRKGKFESHISCSKYAFFLHSQAYNNVFQRISASSFATARSVSASASSVLTSRLQPRAEQPRHSQGQRFYRY